MPPENTAFPWSGCALYDPALPRYKREMPVAKIARGCTVVNRAVFVGQTRRRKTLSSVRSVVQHGRSMHGSLLLKGFLLGWSVAWPPGPISAEMVRRGLERGFWPAWALGLGACSGDFLWAVAVSLGAGVLIDVPGVRPTLGVVSVGLLLFLAWTFGRGRVGGVEGQPDAGKSLPPPSRHGASIPPTALTCSG